MDDHDHPGAVAVSAARRPAPFHAREARRARLVVEVCSALLGLSASPASAFTHVEVAELSGLSATFTYQQTPNDFGGESTSGLTLSISRSGTVVYSAPVRSHWCEGVEPELECKPRFFGPDVHVAVLEPAHEAQVVLDVVTGGAHCCSVAQVFSGPGPNGVTMTEHNFGNGRGRLRPLGPEGQDVFVSVDNRFAYAFTDYADSGMPTQVWALVGGVFTDVTRDYPSLLAADATRQWRQLKARRNDDVGFFAAWAADEELLHRPALVRRALAHALRAGRLRGGVVGESGKRFARELLTDLRLWGYA
jgi:hypothetical protein